MEYLKKLMALIERERLGKEQDMYLVAGQLQCTNVDPVDSWIFFQWLQSHGIPSRFFVKKDDEFCERIVKENKEKDVVVLETSNIGCELLEHQDLWIRARAFVVEWDLGGTVVDKWLHDLPGCRYVFLQHGIIGTRLSASVFGPLFNLYNDFNVSSEHEKQLLVQKISPKAQYKCFVGGLPRYDLLNSKPPQSQDKEKVVFVMMTWRDSFVGNDERFLLSDYWKNLKSLLSQEFQHQIKSLNLKFVVALHHALSVCVKTVEFDDDVILASQDSISYWAHHADIFITDFSSLSFDFLFQNKPVIFWLLDKNDPSLDRNNPQDGGKVLSALKELESLFNVVETLQDVRELLEFYNKRNYVLEEEKQSIADIWFDNRTEISKCVYEQIEKRIKEEQQPKISIIVPVYNVEKYLDKCLESLENQTFRWIEVICINDGSTDGSRQILEKHATMHGNIHVYNQENAGVYHARRNGVEKAVGKYIMFVDPDDWLEEDACEKILNVFEKEKPDIVMYGVSVESENPSTAYQSILVEDWLNNFYLSINDKNKMLESCYFINNMSWTMWNKALTIDVARKAFGAQKDAKLNFAEDMITCYYILTFSNTLRGIRDKLYHYRHGIGISTREKMQPHEFIEALCVFKVIDDMTLFAKEHYRESEIGFKTIKKIKDRLISTLLSWGLKGIGNDINTWLVPLQQTIGPEGFDNIIISKAISLQSEIESKNKEIFWLKKHESEYINEIDKSHQENENLWEKLNGKHASLMEEVEKNKWLGRKRSKHLKQVRWLAFFAIIETLMIIIMFFIIYIY